MNLSHRRRPLAIPFPFPYNKSTCLKEGPILFDFVTEGLWIHLHRHGRRCMRLSPAPYPYLQVSGFWFLAFAYGFYMYTLEFSFIYPTLMAMIIFGGSLEFVTVSMLLSPFAPWQALVVALTVQARHLFYGLSMLEKYKGTGWKKPFLIFWMCDETFALNYSSTIPYDVDRGWYYFWVSFLNYSYWVSGALLGGLLGTVIQFNAKGLSFVMTSMFLVIFLEQWLKEGKHYTALIGLVISLGALCLFGRESFIIPAMAGMMLVLTIFRKPLEKAGGFL